MATSKLWPVTAHLNHVLEYAKNKNKTSSKVYDSKQYQSLEDVLTYAENEEKTEQKLYVSGINCDPDSARDEFILVKEQYGKTNGIQAYHGYLSFKEMDITPELAHEVGMKFANEVWGKRFQVVVTTHLNTKHLHCHFVINSVSFKDGKRCQDTSWFKFRKVADRFCEEYKLYYDANPNRSKQSDYLEMLERSGEPTRYTVLRKTIDEVISQSTNINTFKEKLNKLGYKYNLSPSRKYWTVMPAGYSKPIRLKNLGNEYTNDRILERLSDNRNGITTINRTSTNYKNKNTYNLPTRLDKIKKVGGLKGLYLHYLYRLGYLPKYNRNNVTRVHYLLKDDLVRLDMISKEARLLSVNNIENAEQLFSFKESINDQISKLEETRNKLRKESRLKANETKTLIYKESISEVTKEIRKLKKDIVLCDDIARRSKVMEAKIEMIEQEENQKQRKEQTRYV